MSETQPTEAQTLEESVAQAVFKAVRDSLVGQLHESITEVLVALETQMATLKLAMQEACHSLKINPPSIYDGKVKALADQFVQQVEAAAEFEWFL